MELLLCTNQDRAGQPAIEYGIWLAEKLHVPARLLGVVEKAPQRAGIERLLGEYAGRLEGGALATGSLIVEGRAEQVIADQAVSGDFLTVVGALGRSGWNRLWRGRSFRRLMDSIASPLLFVPAFRPRLGRILLCAGGLRYAEGVLRIAEWVAASCSAGVTLLHISEPTSLEYAVVEELRLHADDLLGSDTPQSRYLRQARSHLQAAGIEVEIKVRQGYVVHEILAEIKESSYDLVALGSQYGVESLRHLFTPNVTAEIVEAVDLPVLVARYQPELA